jgi:hypothetical protein
MASTWQVSAGRWVAAGGLLLLLCGFVRHPSDPRTAPLVRHDEFLGARVQCSEKQEIFAHGRRAVVPFATTVFDHGGFDLEEGRLTIPADGVYLVEANVSIRSQSPKLAIGPSVRMVIRSVRSVIAAASTTQLDDDKRTTCLSAATTAEFKKGDLLFVELATEAMDDPEKKYPILAPELGPDVCHLSVALLGEPPAVSK